ncbi:MAG: class I SAM-dependent methyltransferase [Candidatus Micrarchaeota archaeon]
MGGDAGGNSMASGRPMPLIISRSPDARLMKPPTLATVLRATERFAPRYDEWMRESHHPIALEILRNYVAEGHSAGPIAELGCGTGVLSANLMVSMSAEVLSTQDSLLQVPKLPLKFILLDMSEVMLGLARANVRNAMQRLIESMPFVSPGIHPASLHIVDSDDGRKMQLMVRELELLRVRFECRDAKDLREVEDGGEVRTAILSYVMHWIRGSDEKCNVASMLFNTLPPGGRLISIEESPLVVRTDLHPDDNEVQKLARLIRIAVTVLQIPEISSIFQLTGFHYVPATLMRKRIDEYHDMYGMVFHKD